MPRPVPAWWWPFFIAMQTTIYTMQHTKPSDSSQQPGSKWSKPRESERCSKVWTPNNAAHTPEGISVWSTLLESESSKSIIAKRCAGELSQRSGASVRLVVYRASNRLVTGNYSGIAALSLLTVEGSNTHKRFKFARFAFGIANCLKPELRT